AATWTSITVALATMLWFSGFRDWSVYLLVMPSFVLSVLLWFVLGRSSKRIPVASRPLPGSGMTRRA
ncbi:hypothetical protein CFP71_42785, partial [Amycolatopsis thailandensis]